MLFSDSKTIIRDTSFNKFQTYWMLSTYSNRGLVNGDGFDIHSHTLFAVENLV